MVPVFAQDESTDDPEASPTPTPAGDRVETPVITDISIAGGVERKGAKVTLRGKNLFPTKGSVSVNFPNDSGGNVSVSSFSITSATTLVFELPDGVGTGNVTVTTKGEKGTSQTSAPYQFQFHQPKILFVTGEDGIAPGKTITIWGEYLDGVYLQDNGRSRVLPISTADFKGADLGSTGDLSVIQLKLPEGDFKKEFWVERGCDENNENCLKSNSISFAQVLPPVLTEIQVDYATRTAAVFGKNFPLEQSDFSISFDGKKVSTETYDSVIGKATFSLPCPLPYRAEVLVKNKSEESNPLLFIAEDAPAILDIAIKAGNQSHLRNIELSGNVSLDIDETTVCNTYDNELRIGSRTFDLYPYGGKLMVKNVEFANIPTDGEAHIVINGVQSPKVPFSKEVFSPEPYIYRLESKYGLRHGAPFSIFGRNLGSLYKACDRGETTITGPAIYDEEFIEEPDGFDEEGEPKFKEICQRIAPDVTPAQISAQFKALPYGSEPKVGESTLSVTVGNKKSNSISFTFGDTSQKVAYAAPEVTAVEFPKGRNIGDPVIIRGSGFAPSAVQNSIKFGSVTVWPKTANSRGTELEAVIPEGAGSDIVVTRRIPEPEQQSEAFPVVISSVTESGLTFELPEAATEPVTISIDDKRTAVTVAEMQVVNSIADLQINRFRMQMRYRDGDPEDAFSLKKLKVAPFTSFTLKRNGATLSRPTAAQVGNGIITLEFEPFVLPITTAERDTLTLDTEILRFVTDGSSFSVTFDPTDPVSLQALDLDRITGIRPKNKTALKFGAVTIDRPADDLCIDTDSSNIHCDNYLQSLTKKSVPKQSADQPSIEPDFNRHKQNRIALITTEDKTEAMEKRLLVAREMKLRAIAERIGEGEILDRIRQALEKRDEGILKNYRDSLLGASRSKIAAQEEAAIEQRNQMREQQAAVRRKNQPIASQLGMSRIDSDRDGLTDEEESLLGTDLDDPDTDGDGYTDFQEVEFGISPFRKNTTPIFSDLANAGSAGSSIARLYFLDLLDGYDDGTFRPLASASRAQFVTTMSRAFFGFGLSSPHKSPALDISSDDWFAPEVDVAKSAGYLSAEFDVTGAFRPHAPITRIQACRLALLYAKANPRNFQTSDSPITDVTPQDLGWASECITRRLLKLTDTENGIFAPNTELTRAEMAEMAYRTAREQN